MTLSDYIVDDMDRGDIDIVEIKYVKEFLQRETVLIVELDCGEITTEDFWKERNKLLGDELI